MNVSSPRPKKLYACKWCNKQYKSKNGLGYHTKKCTRTSATSPSPPQFVLDETLIPSMPPSLSLPPLPLTALSPPPSLTPSLSPSLSPSPSPIQMEGFQPSDHNILCDVIESTQDDEEPPKPLEPLSKEIIQFFYDSSKNSGPSLEQGGDSTPPPPEDTSVPPVRRVKRIRPSKEGPTPLESRALFLPERPPTPTPISIHTLSQFVSSDMGTSQYRGFMYVMLVVWVVNTVVLFVMTVQTWYEM